MIGRLGGDVFECEYARHPDGCGRTIHCSGCAIRRSVTTTFQTGQALHHVPAQLKQYPQENRQVEMLISTEKVGDTVWLRIEALSPADGPCPAPTDEASR
jgi:hypothetical protein